MIKLTRTDKWIIAAFALSCMSCVALVMYWEWGHYTLKSYSGELIYRNPDNLGEHEIVDNVILDVWARGSSSLYEARACTKKWDGGCSDPSVKVWVFAKEADRLIADDRRAKELRKAKMAADEERSKEEMRAERAARRATAKAKWDCDPVNPNRSCPTRPIRPE